jgi:N-acyl-D-amino-acid deacylase
MVGSDGIYLGGHPHPRGWGSFARVLGRHVRDRKDICWGAAAARLAAAPADLFGLGQRGRIQAGGRA